MRFSIDVRGAEEAADYLDRVGRNAVDAKPILNRMARDIIGVQRQRFEAGRFKRLAASTKARKKREGLDRRPLRATGVLMRSLTIPHGPQQTYNIYPDALSVGTKIRYAFYHQVGKGVPKRKPLDLTPKQRKPLAEELLKHLMEGR